MTGRIFRSIFVAALVAMLVCLVVVTALMYGYFGDLLNQELLLDARLLAAGIEKDGIEYLESCADEDIRITWIDEGGNVLFDNQYDHTLMENHLDRQEVKEALEEGQSISVRYSDTLAYITAYCAVRLGDGTVIRVADIQYTIWHLAGSMAVPILLMLVVVTLLTLLVSTTLSKRIVRPINEIDMEHPEKSIEYRELTPLLDKLKTQSDDIAAQLELLERRRNEFRLITENMQEGFVTVGAHGEILSYNTSALQRMGDESGALILQGAFRQAVDEALDGKHSEQTSEQNGAVLSIIADPVYEKDVLSGAVVIILDVTEKEQSEKLRREFTSNVSHELKTPLTSIYGISELMMNGIVKPEDSAGFARNIHDETGRLITLIEDIINLSQLDENSVPQEKTPVDLYLVAQSVVNRLSGKAAGKDISLILSGSTAVVSGIYGILEEMIYNLTDNAIKYNIDGGKVEISVGSTDGNAVVTVSDTGIGIPEEHQARVFERFYRVDKSHSRKIGGTGLGLSIVKHGAAYHGATVKLESVVGKGTRFTIRF